MPFEGIGKSFDTICIGSVIEKFPKLIVILEVPKVFDKPGVIPLSVHEFCELIFAS